VFHNTPNLTRATARDRASDREREREKERGERGERERREPDTPRGFVEESKDKGHTPTTIFSCPSALFSLSLSHGIGSWKQSVTLGAVKFGPRAHVTSPLPKMPKYQSM